MRQKSARGVRRLSMVNHERRRVLRMGMVYFRVAPGPSLVICPCGEAAGSSDDPDPGAYPLTLLRADVPGEAGFGVSGGVADVRCLRQAVPVSLRVAAPCVETGSIRGWRQATPGARIRGPGGGRTQQGRASHRLGSTVDGF